MQEQEQGHEALSLDDFKQIAGAGMQATIKGKKLLGGNQKLLNLHGMQYDFQSQNSLFYFVIDEVVVAVYELTDSVKSQAKNIIESLQHKGIDVVMLTGDNEKSAARVAQEIGITHYLFEQTPENKASFVAELHQEGKKVVMVGDGVNDILALANADIGIVMGSGSDIAIDVSDVVLLNSSLESLDDAFKISRTTFGLIKQNLGLSLIYNAITIPLAMAGYVIPLVAAISMSVSSLLVVGNSMRIRLSWKKN